MTRGGFSLIELLTATAVLALLMAALMGVMSTLGRAEAAMSNDPDQTWQADLRRGLRADLRQSREVLVDENALRLDGWRSVDTRTGAIRHRPTSVTYRLTEVGEAHALIREETADDGAYRSAAATVCFDVAQWKLELIEEDPEPADADAENEGDDANAERDADSPPDTPDAESRPDEQPEPVETPRRWLHLQIDFADPTMKSMGLRMPIGGP